MEKKEFPPVRLCLFDMDGLLINSEDIYSLVVNKILQEYGKPNLPWSIKALLQGRPAPQSYKMFQDWAQLPISSTEFIERQLALQTLHFPTSQPLPGVLDLLQNLSQAMTTGSTSSLPVHMALATSSMKKNFLLKTSHLPELFSRFTPSRTIVGDDPRLTAGRGKPLPDIYLLALDIINKEIAEQGEPPILPEECLVFEDSVPGVEAGRRAGMRVVWVPHEGLYAEFKDQAEEVLAGSTGQHKEDNVADFKADLLDDVQPATALNSGKPGELNDGWGQLLFTLENFPYEKYGIKIL
ncbi:hypothetical protein FQN57_002570 [Myotisia sp. PD_48]|nr:hypothetical protein FQN57_002570 [Myotisia sp. PD_48]